MQNVLCMDFVEPVCELYVWGALACYDTKTERRVRVVRSPFNIGEIFDRFVFGTLAAYVVDNMLQNTNGW